MWFTVIVNWIVKFQDEGMFFINVFERFTLVLLNENIIYNWVCITFMTFFIQAHSVYVISKLSKSIVNISHLNQRL